MKRSSPAIEASVAALRADVVSGAAVVARAAARIVERMCHRLPSHDLAAFRVDIEELVGQILGAQPSMAPLLTLASAVLEALAATRPLPDLRQGVASAAAGFREALDRDLPAVARQASLALPARGRILTLSASSTVRVTLLGLGERKSCDVICLESRPMNEGAVMARSLAGAGVPTTLAVDAAGDLLARDVDAVLLGADSIGDLGIVNKIGSRAVSLAAREAGVPVYVVADHSKFLPPGAPQPPAGDRPPEEIGPPAAGLRIWNRYFEVLPLGLVTAVITDAGPLAPTGVQELRHGLTVPVALERWLRDRRAGRPGERR